MVNGCDRIYVLKPLNRIKDAAMRKITAYIHDFMTEKVTDALRTESVHGVTVIKCEGFGCAYRKVHPD